MDAKDTEEYDELEYDESEDDEFDLGKYHNAPTANLYSTRDLHEMIHEGEIELDPPYQRDVVWPDNKQMRLLDSLWRNYYVPPIVFAVIRDDSQPGAQRGSEIRRVVDGKQRLTAIQRFIDGQTSIGVLERNSGSPVRNLSGNQDHWFQRNGEKISVKRRFPVEVEYHDLPDVLERDIFQRVQLGVALTAAEKLQAIASPKSAWISDLLNMYFLSQDSLRTTINIAVSRASDFQHVAGLAFCCYKYPEQVFPNYNQLERWLSQPDVLPEDFMDQVRETLTAFWYIASNEGFNHGFSQIDKRVAPAEFVFIGVMLFLMRDKAVYPYKIRADAVLNMRQHIRAKFQDIRLRQDICRELWRFIEITTDKEAEEPPPPLPPAKKAKKRKATNDDEDEDRPRGTKGRRK